MTRVNWREIHQRFSHIDGEIVSAGFRMGPGGVIEAAHVVLSFYPWWEHPLFVAASEAGQPWGFQDTDDGSREMRIEAVGACKCMVRAGGSAIDLAFSTEHPSLWVYEEHADILCNSDVDARALLDALTKRNLPRVRREDLAAYLAPADRHRAPFSLGPLPRSLFGPVHEELRRRGVAMFVTHEPKASPPLVLLEIDDSVEIVAEDFVVDVPEFEHRPEWFRPQPGE